MKIIVPFLKIQNQLRIYHWQTTSYAQHKAFGKAYKDLDGLIDTFIETFMGKYGPTKAKFTYKFELSNFDEYYNEFIDNCLTFLLNLENELNDKDTDLLNIRDEMLGTIHKLKYLLSLS